jgi:hypothetical protein
VRLLDPKFTGCWMIGCREVYPDGSFYEGQFLGGKRTQQGTIAYENGTVYRGQWLQSQKQGTGSLHFRDGTRFEGTFQGGKRHGVGVLRNLRGKKLVAEWNDGKMVNEMVSQELLAAACEASLFGSERCFFRALSVWFPRCAEGAARRCRRAAKSAVRAARRG